MTGILTDLNPEQCEAVTHGTGPLLIFAGAGSGKTRVLTYRIAHLVRESQANPGNILAVTFTNKAANEMRERIQALIGNALRGMWVGTFHATCSRILRVHGERAGVDPRFVVFDTADQQALIKECLSELDLDAKRYKPQDLLSLISNAKNELIDPRRFETNARGFMEQLTAKVYHLYQNKLRLNRACDFDDLLLLTAQLLQDNADIADQYQERFQHILVDEYQDINFAQYKVVENLARKHRNICVVGDDDQSIYAWRGADVRLILQFEQDYPDAKVVKLEQNYRSTQVILDAAHAVISKNAHRKAKRLWTAKEGGPLLCLQETANEQEEALYAIEKIQELLSSSVSLSATPHVSRRYSDIAILYRVNAQSRVLEEAFVKYHVPHRLVGAVQFYQRKEIKDVVAYLKILHNPFDTVSLRRIINVPTRGIGAKTIELLEQEATRRNCSLMEIMELIEQSIPAGHPGDTTRRRAARKPTPPPPEEAPTGTSTPQVTLLPSYLLSPRVGKSIGDFVRMLHRLRSDPVTRPVEELWAKDFKDRGSIAALVRKVLDHSGYLRELEEERSLEAAERMENIKELLSAAQAHDERVEAELDEAGGPEAPRHSLLESFLESIALVSDVDKLQVDANAVTLMTLHAAKGLEFPIVFLVGMEEDIFPLARSKFEPQALEEERRLCYVGLTRAMDQIYLTYAHRRTLYGMTADSRLSQFVRDIPPELLDRNSRTFAWHDDLRDASERPTRSPLPGHRQQDSAPVKTMEQGVRGDSLFVGRRFSVGDKVRHGKWGEGIVVRVPGDSGEQEWVEVAFPRSDVGIKKLMLEYAPLERVS